MLRCWITVLSLCWLMAGTNAPCSAQILRLTDENPRGVAKPGTQPEETVRKEFRFTAAAEPSPPLRYQFWVVPVRREPGNAVAHLLRANVMLSNVSNLQQLQRDWQKTYEAVEELPLSKFPTKEARTYLENFRSVLDALRLAERVERIDYDFRVQELRGLAFFGTLLPEIQRARDFARLLHVEAKLAIAEGRYDDAIESLRTGFRLAEIVSKLGSSFIVAKLVAIAIDSMMLDAAQTMMQQPGAPNLYWALASLPDDMGDMRYALEGEKLAFENSLHRVTQLPSEPISHEAWQNRIVATVNDARQLQDSSSPDIDGTHARMIAGILVLTHGDLSKESLRGQGLSKDALETMTYSEAAIRATRERLLKLQSEYYKWSLVPRSEANINELAEQYLKDQMTHDRLHPATLLASLLLPAVQAAQAAGDRVLTKRNQLITLEAIRAYAAANDNRLPASLEKLQPLPAWKQAGTAKPFEYERISDTEAVLRRAPYWPGRHDQDAEIGLTIGPGTEKAVSP